MKQKKIIHGIKKIDDEWHYLCIHSCNITDSKTTLNPKKVTCKNCKQILKSSKPKASQKANGDDKDET